MKVALTILLIIFVLSNAQEKSVVDAFDFIKGFGTGLHFERLSPTIEVCTHAISIASKAFSEAIHAYQEHQPFYNFMNNVTIAMGTSPRVCRKCVVVPSDVWRNLEEMYFKKFDYKWENYFHAVFLNLGYRMDEIIYNVLKAKSFIEVHDFLNAGYFSGTTVNIIFNVSTDKPIPPPPPIDDDFANRLELGTNWTDIHQKFRTYYNYSMITLNYTKWINGTTSRNLNSSVMSIEMKGYTALMLLYNPTPANILEAVLTIIDSLEYLNALFNGLYFAIEQIPQKIFKDSIFEHIAYTPLNLVLHLGYFVWDGYRLYNDWKADKYLDMSRRVAILFRKFMYFDEDTLDEILNKVSMSDI